MTIAEFFGTLQESITAEWRKHLQTNKYSDHMALDDFYKEMPEKVDALIEAYQADNDVVKDYKNVLKDDMDALEYLEELKKITKEGRELLKSSELESLTDDILSLIDSTIYKLKHLKESMSLKDYLVESLGEKSLYSSIVIEAKSDAVIDFMVQNQIGWLYNGGGKDLEIRLGNISGLPDFITNAAPEQQLKIKYNGKTQPAYYSAVSQEIRNGIHIMATGGGGWRFVRKSSRGNVFEPITNIPEDANVQDIELILKGI